MSVSPELLRLAAKLRAQAPAVHVTRARTALSYRRLLTEGERWFLGAIQRLSSLSERQWARLQAIEAKVELAR